MSLVSSILSRFTEPSSWAGLGLALFGSATTLPPWWAAAASIGGFVCSAAAFFLKEKTS